MKHPNSITKDKNKLLTRKMVTFLFQVYLTSLHKLTNTSLHSGDREGLDCIGINLWTLVSMPMREINYRLSSNDRNKV